MENDKLIQKAADVLKPYKTTDDRLFGDVGAAVISKKGIFIRAFVLIRQAGASVQNAVHWQQ